MNRRDFLGLVGVGGMISYLPVAVTGCSKQTVGGDNFVKVGTLSDLAAKGQLAQGKVLVIASDVAPQEVIAVNPTCTHAGCAVAWEKDQKAFVCPCHESHFGSDGKVLQGPAEEPLTVYATKLEGDDILVKIT